MINFPHMALLLGGANVSNAQEKSVQHLFLDECWTYSDLIQQFKRRLHDRWNGKTVLVTQAHESPHALDAEWTAGRQWEWVHDCPGCGKMVRPSWLDVKWDDARREDGTWHWAGVVASVHRARWRTHLRAELPDDGPHLHQLRSGQAGGPAGRLCSRLHLSVASGWRDLCGAGGRR